MESYYQIVTFGSPSYGRRASFYRNADRAIRDAADLGGGSLQTVRVVVCKSRRDALEADISEARPVIYNR